MQQSDKSIKTTVNFNVDAVM